MSDLLTNLATGFGQILTFEALFYCFIGVFVGTFIGVLPGIGSLAAMAMLLPVTFYLEPTTALVMLAGVYYGAEYGGSTSSILLNMPGTPANAVTCLDGHPMAKQGRAGLALFMTTIASFVGGSIGIVALYLFSPAITDLARAFAPAEYFAIMVFGLVAASTVSNGAPLKGLAMVVFGLMLGTVGTDLDSGVARYDHGFYQLRDGISFVALAMGLFGLSEIILSASGAVPPPVRQRFTLRSMLPTRAESRASTMPILRGAGIGGILGALPGTGPAISAFVAYAVERRVAKDPSRFGHGAIEGISAPESANNAAVQTSFIPTLTLGIPGSATMAVFMGALIIHGLTPGPGLVRNHPEVFWGLAASFWIGNVFLLVLNIPLIGLWVRVLQIPSRLLYPAIILLICIGVYSVRNSMFDVLALIAFGLLGYVLRIMRFDLAPVLMGFILGPLIEENFRRAMLLARGDPMVLLSRPISGSILVLTGVVLVMTLLFGLRAQVRRHRARTSAP